MSQYTPALPLTFRGIVVAGDARGRQLGFPTANVRLGAAEARVPDGVYAGRLDGRPAAISIGVRPTFGNGLERLLEAHVLDFEGDLYGRDVTLELQVRLRGERAFASVDDLVDQLRADVAAARAALGA